MRSTLRLELMMVLTLAVSVTALVVALRSDGSPQAIAGDANGNGTIVTSEVPEGATVVEIADFLYDPDPVRIYAGESVAWTNFDTVAHTATASKGDGGWDTGNLFRGDTAVVTFDEPGTYAYLCSLHPPVHGRFFGAPDGTVLAGGGGGGMVGTIVVMEGGK